MSNPFNTRGDPHVSIFIPSVRGGGAERAMLVFAGEAFARGYRVDLVVCNSAGVLRELVPGGVRLIDLACRRMSLALPGLVRYLRNERPAALFSTIMHANVVAAFAARFSGSRTTLVVRESNAPVSEPKSSVSRMLTYRLLPFTYRWADAVIAVSQGVAGELRAISPALSPLIKVIGTPVISEEIVRLGDEQPRHPWFQPGQIPVILGAGRLQAHKGFEMLIRAFAKFRLRHAARLVILGEGPERERLESEVMRLSLRSEVSLPGFTPNPFAYMKRARIFALSSEYEGLPNVLIQALAFGTPVVATDCRCGPAEILGGGRYGELVPVSDVDAMAQALEQAFVQTGSEEGRQSVLTRFSVGAVTTEYLKAAGLPARSPIKTPDPPRTAVFA